MHPPVTSHQFEPDDLRISGRVPGISAFMRIRDGAFSLEQAIRSHIAHFDEVVAVYNRCTDGTPDILHRLAQEYGPKLRVMHYEPEVFPPGSAGHIREPANSPHSLVNYYNFALAQTRFAHVAKLDDDHVAMPGFADLVADVRAGRAGCGEMACFSGLNLARGPKGMLGILLREPFAGSGDHWIFPVRPDTYFAHDPRFEVLRRGGMRRVFHSIAYWHLKYLKPGHGFDNYDLKDNPDSRYNRKLKRHLKDNSVVDIYTLQRLVAAQPRLLSRLRWIGVPVPERDRIIADREFAVSLLDVTLLQGMERFAATQLAA